jgi:hypothetical protein
MPDSINIRVSADRPCGARTRTSNRCSTPIPSARTILTARRTTTSGPEPGTRPVSPRTVHEDDSLLKYYDAKGLAGAGVSKMAFTFTLDWGCEYGGGANATTGICEAGDWFPDPRTREVIFSAGVLVKF